MRSAAPLKLPHSAIETKLLKRSTSRAFGKLMEIDFANIYFNITHFHFARHR
jgi:hypothetical protein